MARDRPGSGRPGSWMPKAKVRTVAVTAAVAVALLATAVATYLLLQQGAAVPGPSGTAAAPPSGTATGFPSTPPAATYTPLEAATSAPTSPVQIEGVIGAGNVDAEMVTIQNHGELVSLRSWTLSDTEGDSYTFPELTLFPDGEVRLRSTAGTSGPSVLYWGRDTAAWRTGDLLKLRDAEGGVVAVYVVR